jgi:hypothetical protein
MLQRRRHMLPDRLTLLLLYLCMRRRLMLHQVMRPVPRRRLTERHLQLMRRRLQLMRRTRS